MFSMVLSLALLAVVDVCIITSAVEGLPSSSVPHQYFHPALSTSNSPYNNPDHIHEEVIEQDVNHEAVIQMEEHYDADGHPRDSKTSSSWVNSKIAHVSGFHGQAPNYDMVKQEFNLPYSAIGMLEDEKGTTCSGTFIHPHVILTAAHCVYDQNLYPKTLASKVFFRQKGCTGNVGVNAPIKYTPTDEYVPDGYINKLNVNFDYALVVTKEESPVTMNLADVSTVGIGGGVVVIGYPGFNNPKSCMMESAGKIIGPYDPANYPGMFSYSCDTASGMSGGPICDPKNNNIVGIDSQTKIDTNTGKFEQNVGVAMTASVMNDIQEQIKKVEAHLKG